MNKNNKDYSMEKIVRNLGDVLVDKLSRRVEGYALLFETLSKFIGWYETIERGAITEEIINKSDVFALFNHDSNKVLARSENGKGTLKLEIDDRGLKYSFDAPKTALGDELLEYLDRGDIHLSSFAFYIDFGDDTMVSREYRNGDVYYTIKHIPVLVDVSPVWTPAYAETYVGKRALELSEQMRNENKNQITDMTNKEIIKSIEETIETRSAEEEKEEKKEEKKEEQVETVEEKEQESSVENDEEKQDEEEEKEEQERSINDKNKINSTIKMKEEKFSLIKAIRAIANNQEVDAVTKKVVELGAQEMRNSGLSFGGQIQIPVSAEKRDGVTVTGVHDDLIVTEFANILEPLQSRNVLVEAGATYIPNLVGDLQFPVMGAEQVGWAGEIEDAADGTGTWSHITLTPHRLTAYIDISKQFLAQDSLGAELVIRNQLVTALNTKLEATILSDVAAGGGRPAGLFYNSSVLDVSTFVDITELEASVEEENIYGLKKYIISPKAKAALRSMPRSSDCTRLVMENNEIDGTPALSTTHMADYTLAYGDWSNVAIGQWGGIDLVVDPYTVARSGQVRIVINAFFDFKLLRDGAIVYGATPSA